MGRVDTLKELRGWSSRWHKRILLLNDYLLLLFCLFIIIVMVFFLLFVGFFLLFIRTVAASLRSSRD